MTEKKSFLIYRDWNNFFKLLTDEELGVMFRAIFNYALNDIEPNFDNVGMVWVFSILKGHLDRDKEKYEVICEIRRENGRKGGLRKQENLKQKIASDSKCYQKLPNSSKLYQSVANLADNDNDNVNDNVNVNENDITPSTLSPKADGGYSDDFLLFWAEYPKKVGKAEAFKRYKKLKLTKTDNADIITALKWQRDSAQWQRDGGRYVPNPATYLSQRRWEDEPVYDGYGQYGNPNRYTDGDELPDFILNGGY